MNTKIYVLSSRECNDEHANNGDCFIIDNGKELVICDCGCEDFAKYVEEYMKKHGYEKVKVVLSHNDSDHFDGIPKLIKDGKISEITTVLLLKYVEELLDIIDDGRKNREKLKEQIKERYNNIAELSGNNLKDAFEHTKIAEGIKIVGPGKEYILNAAAKGLDTTEGDKIDGETVVNATSLHLSIEIGNKKVLLTGDSTKESVDKERLEDFKVIQLPHHGKAETGEAIMEELKDEKDEVYIVSDNTGDHLGGSDDLKTKGYDVRNTKNKGKITIDQNTITRSEKTNLKGTLNDLYNYKRLQ